MEHATRKWNAKIRIYCELLRIVHKTTTFQRLHLVNLPVRSDSGGRVVVLVIAVAVVAAAAAAAAAAVLVVAVAVAAA